MKKYYLIVFTTLLFSSINAQQLAPSLIWQKCLGGSGEDKANTIIRTVDNGYLIAGSSKSNDGDVTGHHGSLNFTDAWVVKLSENGNLLWQKSYGGSGDDEITQLIATNDGGYIGIGTTSSKDGDVSGNHGGVDIWVIKLDRHGNLLWQKCYGGTKNEESKSIKTTRDGGYIIIGSTSSNDGDVSGNHETGQYPRTDIWVIKITALGSLEWQKCYGGAQRDVGYDVWQLHSGEYLLCVDTNSQDGDFAGAGGNGPVSAIFKINTFGDILKRQMLGQRSSAYSIKQLKDGSNQYAILKDLSNCYPMNPNTGTSISYVDTNLNYVSGMSGVTYSYCTSNYSADNPSYLTNGPNNLVLLESNELILSMTTDDRINSIYQNHGQRDGFITKFNVSGQKIWGKCFGGSSSDYFFSLTKDDEFTYVACGYTESNNGDVSGNHGKSDFWVVKVGQTNSIKGTVFADYNSNNIKDAGEPFVDNVIIESQKGAVKAASSTYNGIFVNSVDTGTFLTKVLTPIPYYSVVPVTISTSFIGYNQWDSISFALKPIPGKRDYQIVVYGGRILRPGYEYEYLLHYNNLGTDTLSNKTISLTKDSRLTYVSSDLNPLSVKEDTITWNIASLLPRQSGSIRITMEAAKPPLLSIGDTLIARAFIDSTGDVASANNSSFIKDAVRSSFDPNDKQENRAGIFSTREILDNSYLIYTIRFQNTGNDTAFNVTVRDTLDSNTDWNSLEMIGASHPYKMDVSNGNKITWNFKNILLVDSVHNEPKSHGYITYRIKPKSTLATGATIKNSASIYFDFNPPIQTNIHITTIKEPSLPKPEISKLQTEYCQKTSTDIQGKINNIPPDDVTVSVFIDNTTIQTTGNAFTFKASDLSIGNHTIKIVFKNLQDEQATIHNFTLTKPFVPEVNISANVSSVTNTSSPLIITATNTAGGGISPLYTFSKDRLFTTYLQAENSNNTFNGSSSILDIGSNWIYVRMKTSEACYTNETATDSLNIVRTKQNGLVDKDYPDDVINIYPNPFKYDINIRGLHIEKEYTIVITSASGQEVYRKNFQNNKSITIRNTFQSGKYHISVYDLKKKQLIGSLPLIKL